jgi:20S proteasome subunit alpha 6
MAAIVEHDQDDIDADADADGEDDEDSHQLHVSQIVDIHESESTNKDVESSVNGEPLHLVGASNCRVDESPATCEPGGPPMCGSDTADSGLLEGFHGVDVDMAGDDVQRSTLAEVSSTEVGVDDGVSALAVNPGGRQDVVAVTGDISNASQDGDASAPDDSYTVNTADADSTASSAASPVVAAVSHPIGEDDLSSQDIGGALVATQIDEEQLTASACSTPNASHMELMPASVSVPDVSSPSVFTPHRDIFARREEQSADVGRYPGSQDFIPQRGGKPLVQTYSFASTVPDYDLQDLPGLNTNHSGNGDAQDYEHRTAEEQIPSGEDGPFENPTEPPKSPTPLPSTSSPSNHNDDKPSLRSDGKGPRVPSANRVSISYAGGSRRLVIDAEVVETLKLSRQVGRIEIHVNVDKIGEEDLKGILVRLFPFDVTELLSLMR